MAAAVSSKAGLPENNFRASGNYSRLMDPTYDALYDRYTQTIPLGERKQVVEQAMRLFAEQQIKMTWCVDCHKSKKASLAFSSTSNCPACRTT